MQQTITVKIQIKVKPSEHQILHDSTKAYMDACNFVSDYIYTSHDMKRFNISKVLYNDIRNKYKLRSQMAQSVIATVLAKYKSIVSDKKNWTKVRFSKPQLDLVWNRDYSLNKTKNIFSVNTLEGRIKCEYYKTKFDFKDCEFGTAKLVFKRDKFYLHIPITYEVNELQLDNVTNVVGIDRGIRFIATAYNGNDTVFFDGKAVKRKRAHYKMLRRDLQRVHTPSSRKRLKAIGNRENRWMQDVNHCISKALVSMNNNGTLFVIEDLSGIRSATEKVCIKNRYVSVSWSYYDLEKKLEYKALKNNQRVEKMDPAYTSQMCPKCGHTDKSNRNKKEHIFCCKKCHYRSNDDRVAAMNLYCMGISYLKDNAVPGTVVLE